MPDHVPLADSETGEARRGFEQGVISLADLGSSKPADFTSDRGVHIGG